MIWQHGIVEVVDIDGDINEAIDIERDNDDNMDDAVEVSSRLDKRNEKNEQKFVFHSMPYHYVKKKHTIT